MEKIDLINVKNKILGDKAKNLIPGGAHTYSKGYDQFPSNAPQIIDRGLGCKLWDVDGNEYLDFAMSLGSVLLGHAYPPVLDAVRNELGRGVNFARPSVIEAELAELLVEIIPCAEMVKFAKNGSDAMTAAVKLARAYTNRKYVARCSSDPFNAVHDWFIGSTVMNRGVPEEVQKLTLSFDYNDIGSVQALIDKYPGEIACILLEPISIIAPVDGFLEKLKALCEANGIVLIFDEVVSGFRFALGGVQELTGVVPHLAAFGKGMANGFSVSALVGSREIMSLGGIEHDQERVFLLSTTHGGETHSLAASIATIGEMRRLNASQHYYEIGGRLKRGIRAVAESVGAEAFIDVPGFDCKPIIIINGPDGAPNYLIRTLYLQETIARGLLIPYVIPSIAHTYEDVDKAVEIIGDALTVIKQAVDDDRLEEAVHGACVKPVFRKYN